MDYCCVQLDGALLQRSLEESAALYNAGQSGTDPRCSALAFLLEGPSDDGSDGDSPAAAGPAASSGPP